MPVVLNSRGMYLRPGRTLLEFRTTHTIWSDLFLQPVIHMNLAQLTTLSFICIVILHNFQKPKLLKFPYLHECISTEISLVSYYMLMG